MGHMATQDDQGTQAPGDSSADRRARDGSAYYGSRQDDPQLPTEAVKSSRAPFLVAALLAAIAVLGLFMFGFLAH